MQSGKRGRERGRECEEDDKERVDVDRETGCTLLDKEKAGRFGEVEGWRGSDSNAREEAIETNHEMIREWR